MALKAAEGITDNGLYHYDTPLTVSHEIEALAAAGFLEVSELKSFGATHVIKAVKQAPLGKEKTGGVG